MKKTRRVSCQLSGVGTSTNLLGKIILYRAYHKTKFRTFELLLVSSATGNKQIYTEYRTLPVRGDKGTNNPGNMKNEKRKTVRKN